MKINNIERIVVIRVRVYVWTVYVVYGNEVYWSNVRYGGRSNFQTACDPYPFYIGEQCAAFHSVCLIHFYDNTARVSHNS